MSILIKGIEKPKYGYIEIRLYDDRAECEVQEHVYMDYEIEEVPKSHGRLIDADKLCEYAHNSTVGIDVNDICRFPCVIEAEE